MRESDGMQGWRLHCPHDLRWEQMGIPHVSSQTRRAAGRLIGSALGALALTLLFLTWTSRPTAGHGTLEELVEHRVAIAVGTGNIDLEVELTFHGKYAQGERRRMDRDQDGKISGSELATFVGGTTRRLAEGIRLRADGRELETFQLFNPEPDLLGNDRSGSHPFKLRLFYFARAPRFPLAGGILELEDGLWAEAPALCSPGTGRRDGLRLVSVHNVSQVPEVGTLRVFRFHYPSQGNER